MEIKAVTELADIHRAQVHNYLKATGHRLGLLVNFGNYPKLEWERIVRIRLLTTNHTNYTNKNKEILCDY